MASTLYNQTIPGFIKTLRNVSAMLDQGVQFCKEKGTNPDDLLSFRLNAVHKG